MNRSLRVWQIGGFVFTSLFGVLLHFLYNWSNQNAVVAAFSSVNESTWEHMKILFFPMFAFACLQSFFFKEQKNFWCVKLSGIVLGLVLIPVIFYTINGAFGSTPDYINIAIFFVSAAASYIFETYLFESDRTACKSPWLCFAALCFIAVLFVVFTYTTPRIALFRDPVSGMFGINAAGI